MGVWVPHALTKKNKEERKTLCEKLLSRNNNTPFLHQIVTSDEKWITYDNVTKKKQWLSKNETPISTPRPGLTLRKIMLCVWWDIRGIIHYELLKPGNTVTAEVYCQQIERLNEKLKVKRPSLINRKGVVLLHDNARPHTAKITKKKNSDLNFDELKHPPYSPDLAPSDYYLFRSMEQSLRDKKFDSVQEVEKFLNSYFASKPESFYKKGIEKLPGRWQRVIDNEGDYIL